MTNTPPDPSALEARLSRLEARLHVVESTLEIQALKARYGAVTDRRYTGTGVLPREELEPIAREVASMFTETGVWDGGERLGRCEGRASITERFLAPTLDFAFHLFVKPRIEVDGDEARGTWDILAPCTVPGGRPYWMAGVEHDRYERVDGVWLHAYMKLDMTFMAPYDRSWSPSGADGKSR